MNEATRTAYPNAPDYFRKALSFLGIPELMDHKLNPLIEAWLVNHTHFPADMVNPRTKWCAAFVSAMLEQSGMKSPHTAAAARYQRFGTPTDSDLYSILVIRRGEESFHVAFGAGPAGDSVLALGGNQGNTVSIKLYPRSAVLARRMPT